MFHYRISKSYFDEKKNAMGNDHIMQQNDRVVTLHSLPTSQPNNPIPISITPPQQEKQDKEDELNR